MQAINKPDMPRMTARLLLKSKPGARVFWELQEVLHPYLTSWAVVVERQGPLYVYLEGKEDVWYGLGLGKHTLRLHVKRPR